MAVVVALTVTVAVVVTMRWLVVRGCGCGM